HSRRAPDPGAFVAALLYASRALPELRSFPTRRSSDLLKAEVFAFKRYRDLDDVQRALDEWRAVYNLDRPHEALDFDVPASRYRRSEEHTSELQSREKLVCRLLLEKKKHCDDDIWPGHE